MIEYRWQKGSVPPPHYFGYVIRLGENGQGEIEYFPDYSFNNPPIWVESFSFSPEQLQGLLQRVRDKGFFSKAFPVRKDKRVGGAVWHLTLPGELGAVVLNQESVGGEVFAEEIEGMRALVPAALWEKLQTRRDRYREGLKQP